MDLTAALGWLGLILSLAGTQARTKFSMFVLDAATSVSNALHFYLSDAPGGASGQVIFLYMSMIGIASAARPSLKPMFVTVYPLLAVAAYQAHEAGGALELLPQSVVLTAAIGKQMDSMLLTRVLILVSCAPSLVYGYVIGSTPYVVSCAIFTVFSIVAVFNELSLRRKNKVT